MAYSDIVSMPRASPTPGASTVPEATMTPAVALIAMTPGDPKALEAFEHNLLCPLHQLFPEIRNAIFEFAVALDEPIEPVQVMPNANKFVWGDWEFCVGILDDKEMQIRVPLGPLAVVQLQRTCRQFYHELNGVFYRVNSFYFRHPADCLNYLAAITPERRHQIRNISINMARNEYRFNWIGNCELEDLLGGFHGWHGSCARVLLKDCIGLRRLILVLGDCPPHKTEIRLENPLPQTHHMHHRSSFHFEQRRLSYEQANRNPARVYKELTSIVKRVHGLLNEYSFMPASPLYFPQVEFHIWGTSKIYATVDGKTQAPKYGVPDYVQCFERCLANANEALKNHKARLKQSDDQAIARRATRINLKKILPDLRDDETSLDIMISGACISVPGNRRISQVPMPNLEHFRPFDPGYFFQLDLSNKGPYYNSLSLPNLPIYDEKGLLIWKSKKFHFLDILWKGTEIMCGAVFSEPNQDRSSLCIFESAARCASWDGVHKFVKYFNKNLNHAGYRDRTERKLRLLTERPSPKDIDAVLKATSLLDIDRAPRHLLEAWQAHVNGQDKLIEDLKEEVALLYQQGRKGTTL
ncbi:hypothetical protein F5Y19DRAFT_243604 [Xylariaceae sp. FL1651]|nr:hypothetical protein F5Y19DRAFT_243604 [Xylariaceae sp. FL1651]